MFFDDVIKYYVLILGSLNILAFTFDDSNRAFRNVLINVNNVKPLPMVDDEANFLLIKDKKIKISGFSDKPAKLRYGVYRYVWENIKDLTIVVVGMGIIPQNCIAVSTSEMISRTRKNASGTSVSGPMSTVYSYNTNVRNTI
ncbi:uncharacterized protein EV154DRAFT_488785 [Mucor mucedo]|uniref:uncharacterized protein n=1 Tax=Mucor mucedo TaxID=29922 RepID=UPI0022207E11|nr:uncharacterized protein EV154DRAFT_488785 [Mucor mucedo]KAI7865114.1 hypothetical protein EV154DRAFT_488785 [Mucor mucedo]